MYFHLTLRPHPGHPHPIIRHSASNPARHTVSRPASSPTPTINSIVASAAECISATNSPIGAALIAPRAWIRFNNSRIPAIAFSPAARLFAVTSPDAPSTASTRRSSACPTPQSIQFHHTPANRFRVAPSGENPSSIAFAILLP